MVLLFFGASLVALKKKDGSIRPIAVGCTLRRLVAKCAGSKVMNEMGELFFPQQLGYGIKRELKLPYILREFICPTYTMIIWFLNLIFNTIRRDKMLPVSFCPFCVLFIIFLVLGERSYSVSVLRWWKPQWYIGDEKTGTKRWWWIVCYAQCSRYQLQWVSDNLINHFMEPISTILANEEIKWETNDPSLIYGAGGGGGQDLCRHHYTPHC